jgi:hypothetical protein
MNRLAALLALTAAFALTGCDEPSQIEDDIMNEVPAEAPMAPAAEDVAAPTDVVTPQPAAPPTDSSTLPADKRSSADSVQPESETLFY